MPCCPRIIPTSAFVLPPPLAVGGVPPTRDLCHPCPWHEPSDLCCHHTHPIACVSVFLLLPKTTISDGDRAGLSGVSQGVRAAQNVCGAASLVYPGTQPNPLASSSPKSHTVQPLTGSHGIIRLQHQVLPFTSRGSSSMTPEEGFLTQRRKDPRP